MEKAAIIVLTRDVGIGDVVASAAAAVGTRVVPVPGLSSMPPGVALALVGQDCAADVAAARWSCPRMVVVGFDAQEVSRWSLVLHAEVAVLPEAGRSLTAVLSGEDAATRGRIVAFVGGAGGVGTSTLAAAVAGALADQHRVALVDADPHSAGLDLVVGAERLPGWRWPTLAGASGRMGELALDLVDADGVTLLSAGRPWAPPVPTAALVAVVDSLVRSHEVVVVDVGRGWGELAREAVGLASQTVLVVGACFGSVAAGRATVGRLSRVGCAAVVRDRRQPLSRRDVGLGTGVARTVEIPRDPDVALGLERGLAPWRSGGSTWRSAVRDFSRELAVGHV